MSPEVSFTASIVLAGIGILTLRKTKTKSLWLLGVFPFFFAIQQLAEGFVWLYLKNDISSSFIATIAKNTFLFIGLGLWPFWVPLTVFYNEPNQGRKKILLLFLILGITVSYNLLRTLFLADNQIFIANHSIQYGTAVPYYTKAIYLLTVLGPFLISSIPYMWILGTVVALSFIVTEFFYSHGFISVWCFFAAIISLFIYYIINSPSQLNKTN